MGHLAAPLAKLYSLKNKVKKGPIKTRIFSDKQFLTRLGRILLNLSKMRRPDQPKNKIDQQSAHTLKATQ